MENKILLQTMKRFLHVTLFSLLVIFWGCAPDYGNLITSPKDLPPSIFAFLNSPADSQYVVIRNAVTAQGKDNDHVLEPEFQHLRQAKVALAGGGKDFVFHNKYELKEPYFDAEREFVFVSAHKVRPGEIYRLWVEIPQKGIFTASTTAPGDFQILEPNPGDTFDVLSPLTVKLTNAKGAAGYRVVLRSTFIDSARLRAGAPEFVYKSKDAHFSYVNQSNNPVAVLKHNLDLYYRIPDQLSNTLVEVSLIVDALDTPAWLAHDINSRGGIFEYEKEIRTTPGVYSNIEGGRGLMTATTTKTISLILPPRKK